MTYPFVQAKWYSKGAIIEVRALVIHFAEGGNTVRYFQNPTRGVEPIDVSAHFVLQYDGTIVQMVRDGDADHCQHTDTGSWSYPGNLSRANGLAVLGSEVMDNPDHTRVNRYVQALEIEGFRDQGPNPAQSAALIAWVGERRARFPSIRGLLGHGDVQDKACPGKLIPWASLGGHGLWKDDMPGFKVTFPATVKVGKLFLPKGTGAFRLSDSAPYTIPQDVTRDAVTVVHVGGSGGWQVDLNGDEAHFVSPANPQFIPTTGDCTQLIADARAAEHEKVRAAAIAAVEALP